MSSQAKKDAAIQQFRGVTGASHADAVKFLKAASYRADVAIDSYFESGGSLPASAPQGNARNAVPSASAVSDLFNKYKEEGEDEIKIDGTMKLAEDLGINLEEDIVIFALAFELKSPRMGEWTRQGWTDGLRSLRCDSVESLKAALPRLRQRLASESSYFVQVYNYTFAFGLTPGQRSMPVESATAFWSLLIPYGLQGGALAHVDDLGADTPTSTYPGWKEEHTQWWLEFVASRNVKGVSKDTWVMLVDFVRTIDEKFEKFDAEGSWPSLIDEFAEHAKEKAASS